MEPCELMTVKEIAFKYRISTRTIYCLVRGYYRSKGKKVYYKERFPRPINRLGGKLHFKTKEIEFYFHGESEEYKRMPTRAKLNTYYS